MPRRQRSQSEQRLQKPNYHKQRSSIACEVCRSRKTKCDGVTPQCGFCKRVGADCNYVALTEKQDDENKSTRDRLDALEDNVLQLNRVVATLKADHQHQSPQASTFSDSDSNTVETNREAQRIMHNMMFSIGFDMSRYLTDSKVDVPVSTPLLPQPRPTDLFHHRHMALFFNHVHPWYPILDRCAVESKYILAASGPLALNVHTCLFLLVSAVGATTLALEDGSVDTAADYANHAFTLLHIVMSDHTLLGVQCMILYAIHHLLSFKLIQAYEYLMSASYKIQNLYKLHPELVDTETFKRAFYALFIMERELNVQLNLTDTGILALEEKVGLPSGKFENGNVDSEAITFFLAEIVMQKMMDRSDQHLATRVPKRHNEVQFARLLAEEMEFQAMEWRNHLPLTITFPKAGTCTSDFSLYLKLQYHAHMCGIYWVAVYKAITTKERSAELVSACRKCISAFCLFIETASELFSKPVMLPHVSMAVASVFTMSLAMVCVRKEDLAQEIGKLEDSFTTAVRVLREYGTIYAPVGQWADILDSRLNSFT